MRDRRIAPSFILLAASALMTLIGCPVPVPGTDTPLADQPPAETPPAETPPAETPPAETPPVVTPPATPDTGVVAQPTFTPPAGTYTSARSVTIASTTTGAVVRYTTDGTQPTDASALYTGAISVSSSVTLRAIAKKTDLMSAFGKAEYTITGQVATPVITLNPPRDGTDDPPVEVTIECVPADPDAVIHYRLNGGIPQSTDPVYGGPFTVAQDGAYAVEAIAMKPGWADSGIASVLFSMALPTGMADPPTFDPPGGIYFNDTSVTIASSGADTIYYTTNGTTPTTSSDFISGASGSVSVAATNTVIEAYAVRSGLTDSFVASATYRLKVATPVPDPLPSAVAVLMNSEVHLSTTTSGLTTTIHYNTTGADLAQEANHYVGYVLLSAPHLRANATKDGYEPSDVYSGEYAVKTYVAYTDGAGKVYQLCYNGPDVDITSYFDHPGATMSFGIQGPFGVGGSAFYSSGGHVYLLNSAGADSDITSDLENFAADSMLSAVYPPPSPWLLYYNVGNNLYKYVQSGPDEPVTPAHFAAGSSVMYVAYDDGQGKVFSIVGEEDVTYLFENFTAGSKLVWIDPAQQTGLLGYTVGSARYAADTAGPDPLFDAGEYEHFVSQSVVMVLPLELL
jgi:hypothetical protein